MTTNTSGCFLHGLCACCMMCSCWHTFRYQKPGYSSRATKTGIPEKVNTRRSMRSVTAVSTIPSSFCTTVAFGYAPPGAVLEDGDALGAPAASSSVHSFDAAGLVAS